MTIKMNDGHGSIGVVQLPAPSGKLVVLHGGIGFVYPEDVGVAIQQGWTVVDGQIGMLLNMWIPGASITTAQNFPSGQVALPNGVQANYITGRTSVPLPQVNAALAAGFTACIGPAQF